MSKPNGADSAIFEFGQHRFEAVSGTVTDTVAQSSCSLSPQPAALLGLLLDNAGTLVTHETIRAHLWPDALVEYDQGVHFCIRQIRTALQDPAKSPHYIETLAKRGYKFVAPVTVVPPPQTSQTPPPRSSYSIKWLGGIAALILLLIAAYIGIKPSAQQGTTAITLAIMPMVYADNAAVSASTESLALHLVDGFTGDRRLAIIGPTTTAAFSNEVALLTAASDIAVTYVINGRFVTEGTGVRLLAELIRSSDGAHIWTHWYDLPVEPALAAQEIEAAVIAILFGDSRDGESSN